MANKPRGGECIWENAVRNLCYSTAPIPPNRRSTSPGQAKCAPWDRGGGKRLRIKTGKGRANPQSYTVVVPLAAAVAQRGEGKLEEMEREREKTRFPPRVPSNRYGATHSEYAVREGVLPPSSIPVFFHLLPFPPFLLFLDTPLAGFPSYLLRFSIFPLLLLLGSLFRSIRWAHWKRGRRAVCYEEGAKNDCGFAISRFSERGTVRLFYNSIFSTILFHIP